MAQVSEQKMRMRRDNGWAGPGPEKKEKGMDKRRHLPLLWGHYTPTEKSMSSENQRILYLLHVRPLPDDTCIPEQQ